MADKAIPDLPHNPAVAANDQIEVIDVSNTTNQSNGENTYALISELAPGLPQFVGAGGSHAKGLVPDPGATAHATPYVLGDDGAFHPMTGSALGYSGGTFTFTDTTGGGGTWPGPAGTARQVQLNDGAGGLAAGSWTITTGGVLVPAPVAAPSTPANGSLWLDNANLTLVFRKAGATPRLGGIVWNGRDGNAIVNTTTETSIFAGTTAQPNSTLSFSVADLAVGMTFEIRLLGLYGTSAAVTMTFKFKVNGTVVIQGSAASTGANTGKGWFTYNSHPILKIRTLAGAASKMIGYGTIFTGGAGGAAFLTADGLGSTNGTLAEVTVDLSAGLTIDVTQTWATANAANTIQLLDGSIDLRG